MEQAKEAFPELRLELPFPVLHGPIVAYARVLTNLSSPTTFNPTCKTQCAMQILWADHCTCSSIMVCERGLYWRTHFTR
jgi:hypothetical protein